MKNCKLDYYFQTCIRDACTQENRNLDEDGGQLKKYSYVVLGDYIVFTVYTKWMKVNRRVEYRLRRNLGRNFGLKISDLKYSLIKYDGTMQLDGTVGMISVDANKKYLIYSMEMSFLDNKDFYERHTVKNIAQDSLPFEEYISSVKEIFGNSVLPNVTYHSDNVRVK